jgi:transposase-like protein
MNCPNCDSNNIRKNGQRRGKQNYQCKNCGRQFIKSYSPRGYSQEVKEACLYVNGNGFRAIERMTKVNHNRVIRWVKKLGHQLPDSNDNSQTPEVCQLDELETFIGEKNKISVWTVVDNKRSGIIQYIVGDRSAKTFGKLWEKIEHWKSYFWITDG